MYNSICLSTSTQGQLCNLGIAAQLPSMKDQPSRVKYIQPLKKILFLTQELKLRRDDGCKYLMKLLDHIKDQFNVYQVHLSEQFLTNLSMRVAAQLYALLHDPPWHHARLCIQVTWQDLICLFSCSLHLSLRNVAKVFRATATMTLKTHRQVAAA